MTTTGGQWGNKKNAILAYVGQKGLRPFKGKIFLLGGKGTFEPTTQTDPQEVQFIDLEGPPFFHTNIMNRLKYFFFLELKPLEVGFCGF